MKKGLTNPTGSGIILTVPALVAQLDRVSDYESEGQGFESLSAHQNPAIVRRIFSFVRTSGFSAMVQHKAARMTAKTGISG